MILLAVDPHVPHVLGAEVPGDIGRAMVFLPEDEECSAAVVWVVRDGLAINAHFTAPQLRALAAALLEAAYVLNDPSRHGNEPATGRAEPEPIQADSFPPIGL